MSVVWFVSVLAFLIYAASVKVIPFDEQGKLWQQSQLSEFDRRLTEQVQLELGGVNASVVHFSQANCDCSQVAQEHISSVESLAQQQGYTNKGLVLSPESPLSSIIPATPAVAVFDASGGLVYLGPYSAGYACTQGNGIVESYLNSTNKTLVGATVVSDTKGCYCSI